MPHFFKSALLVGSAVAASIALAFSHGLPRATAASWPGAVPAPAADEAPKAGLETAVLSGGCFWGMQGVFEHVRGVRQVLAGYAGGPKGLAQYELVSTGTTGHA